MLLSHKNIKNRSLPNIQLKNNLRTNLFKNSKTTKAKHEFIPKYITPNIFPTITIMDTIKKRPMHRISNLIHKKNKSLIRREEKNKSEDFENIKIFKGNIVEISNNKSKSKKELRLSKEFNKRNLYLFRNNFNYSCSMDKSDMFSIKSNNKPKESFKQKMINFINNQINQENTEIKYPRMLNIVRRNNFLYDTIMSQPWKYPDLFVK